MDLQNPQKAQTGLDELSEQRKCENILPLVVQQLGLKYLQKDLKHFLYLVYP